MRSSLIASSCAAAALFALSIAPISLASPTSEADAPTPSTQASSPTQTESPTPQASPSTSVPSSDGSTTASGDTPSGESIPNGEDRSATDDDVSLSPEEQIRQRWQDMGAENGVLGTATSGLVPLRDGAFIQFYRGGQIYWTAQYGAHASRAGIHGAYGAQKWENGPLGFPTSDEEAQTIGGIRGALQTYENGQIRWSSQGGAHPIWGKILTRYEIAESEGRSLGWPTANEMKDAANGGVYQHFTGGSIYFHPSTGAHRVTGGIRNLWEGQGWERGHLGYPTSEPYWDGNRQKQNFEHGVLEKTNDFNVTWAGQPNNYFCGPTSGWMILNAIGAHHSAQGTPLSIDAVASRDYMNTVGYGYTSFHDRRFEYGMNRWLGRDAYTTIHTPSVDQVRDSVKSSFRKGLPTAVDAQERRGGPHYNGHPNSTFSHIMVVTSYDPNTDSMRIADPGVHYLWNGEEQFWYHLPSFTQNFLQTEVERDGREHIGIYTAR